MSIENPAGRLHRLLSQGKSKPRSVAASEVWAVLLDADSEDFSDLLRKMSLVYQLPALSIDRIKEVEGFNPGIHLKWVPVVERAFREFRFQMPWSTFIDTIDDASLLSLEVCDHELSRHNVLRVSKEQFSSIKEESQNVRQLILNSDLSREVSDYLLKNLDNIDTSLANYHLTGPEAVRNSVHVTLGSIAGNLSIYQQSTESEGGRAFWELVRKIALIFEIVVASLAIGAFVNTFLEESTGDAHENNQGVPESHSRAVLREEGDD